MIPGPFEICHATLQEGSDALLYRTLSFGYDCLSQALDDLETIAAREEVPLDELAVIHVTFAADLQE